MFTFEKILIGKGILLGLFMRQGTGREEVFSTAPAIP